MLTKLENYKGVIVFYLLLLLIIFCVADRNQKIDMNQNNYNIIVSNA